MRRLGLPLLLVGLFSLNAHAAGGRADYDLDDDGLIEINDLDDLNEIRNHLNGTALYAESVGCPAAGCNGFELSTSLDFDSNGDGILSDADSYWNAGEGWHPIGGISTPFTAIFEGNDQIIRNLMIDRGDEIGLFSATESAQVQNLSFEGALTSIHGSSHVGGVVGSSLQSDFLNVHFTGEISRGTLPLAVGNIGGLIGTASTSNITNCSAKVTIDIGASTVGGLVGSFDSANILESYANVFIKGGREVGGLVGKISNSDIIASFAIGKIVGSSRVGGLVGDVTARTQVTASFSSVNISEARDSVGGLIGDGGSSALVSASFSVGSVTVNKFQRAYNIGGFMGFSGSSSTDRNSHWAIDTSGQISGGRFNRSADGATLAELQCPVSTDSTVCAGSTLYVDWSSFVDAGGNGYWDFGTSTQLPGLVLNGQTFRDSDGDNVLDSNDDFPANFAVSRDTDGDGKVDAFNVSCDSDCQTASGFVLDQFPNNIAASLDADLDGLPDEFNLDCDAACIAGSGLTLDTLLNDTDNDGVNNSLDNDTNGVLNADIDSDGLIGISTLEQLNAVRFNVAGTSRVMSSTSEPDSTGCPIRILDGVLQSACTGYELTQSLNFDSNSNGVIDEGDIYWNAGEGWLPMPLSGTFNGNGFVIQNLMINRVNSRFVALFNYTGGATIRNLGLTGDLTSIQAQSSVAGLVASARNTLIESSFVEGEISAVLSTAAGLVADAPDSQIKGSLFVGDVSAKTQAGGLVGIAAATHIEASFATGQVTADSEAGGLIGILSNDGANIINSYASTLVLAGVDSGGLIGAFGSGTLSSNPVVVRRPVTEIINSYWATDVSRQTTSVAGSGFTSTELQCPTTADNTICAISELYTGWANSLNTNSDPYWNFGSVNELPGLALNGVTYRDADGDGVFDSNDAFPTNYAASTDGDGDGAPDKWNLTCDLECQNNSGLILDNLPDNVAASVDLDLDGLPESFNDNCDNTCRSGSGLTLDSLSNDTDNDGITNLEDNDDNNDGIIDADADSDGLIDIVTLDELNAMRFALNGQFQKVTADAIEDNSGCMIQIDEGVLQRSCRGYELLQDIDFDSNADGVLNAADAYWNSGTGWQPLGTPDEPFSAVLEGNGFSLLNLMIKRISTDYQAFFAYTLNSSISNFGLSGDLMSIEGNRFAASLIASASFTNVINSFSLGDVSARESAGGLVGEFNRGSMDGSFYRGNILIFPSNFSKIRAAFRVGGLIGEASNMSITNSYVLGTLSGEANIGGLVGLGNNVSMTRAYFRGVITARSSNVGGLIGQGVNSTITSSYFIGDILAELDNVGGLIGSGRENSTVIGSFASGSLSARSKIGGLIGSSSSSLSKSLPTITAVDRSYAVITITGTGDTFGGLLSSAGTITNSYWATDATGQATDGGSGGVGVTLAELQCPTAADNINDCATVDLYTGWASLVDAEGNPYWDFGSNQQLPGLIIDGQVGRDSDGDSVIDINDAFAFDATESVDTDGDGIGNNADPDDDNDGVEDALDLFPLDATESVDLDEDGIGDNADIDDDNDGVLDINDSDNTSDNGRPVIFSVPAPLTLLASGETSQVELFTFANEISLIDFNEILNAQLNGESIAIGVNQFGGVDAFDAVDFELELEISYNGLVLVLDGNDQVALPSGPLSLQVVAIDDAGNRSDPAEFIVNIYPQVLFTLPESVTGEPSQARLAVTLSGPSPEYPIVVGFSLDTQSADLADLDTEIFDSENITISIENAAALDDAALIIPVIDDGVVEADETMLFSVSSVQAGQTRYDELTGAPIDTQHVLSVTEANLAPAVSIIFTQNDIEVISVDSKGGDVIISAVVNDPNGNDTHSFVWDTTDLQTTVGNVSQFTFSPASFEDGLYNFSVSITDSGESPLSAESNGILVIEEVDNIVVGSGGGGGGSTNLNFLLLLLLSLSFLRWRREN